MAKTKHKRSLSVIERLMKLWSMLSTWPLGKRIFSLIAGFYIPYTGTVYPIVSELKPGLARVLMRDRHRVRNHLDSMHAVALVNVGEFASGLSVMSRAPVGTRGIVTKLEIEYLKKARGTVVAEAIASEPVLATSAMQYPVLVSIKNGEGIEVAKMKVTWMLKPTNKDLPSF
jgi:acyl-coenzyme A thioesterase PaaI-like protein